MQKYLFKNIQVVNEGKIQCKDVLTDGERIERIDDRIDTKAAAVEINGEGRHLLPGAIDDRPSSEAESLEGATNYVTLALAAHEAGEAPETPYAQPYGCSIKYADELEA